MIGYGGFGMANAMFTIVPIFIGVVFVLILAGIAVQAVRGPPSGSGTTTPRC